MAAQFEWIVIAVSTVLSCLFFWLVYRKGVQNRKRKRNAQVVQYVTQHQEIFESDADGVTRNVSIRGKNKKKVSLLKMKRLVSLEKRNKKETFFDNMDFFPFFGSKRDTKKAERTFHSITLLLRIDTQKKRKTIVLQQTK